MVVLERLQDISGIELYAVFLVPLLPFASEHTVGDAFAPVLLRATLEAV